VKNKDLEILKFRLRKNRFVALVLPNTMAVKSASSNLFVNHLVENNCNGRAGNKWKHISIKPSHNVLYTASNALASRGTLYDDKIKPEYSEFVYELLSNSEVPNGLDLLYNLTAHIQDYNLLIVLDKIESFESIANELNETQKDQLDHFNYLIENTLLNIPGTPIYFIFCLAHDTYTHLEKCEYFTYGIKDLIRTNSYFLTEEKGFSSFLSWLMPKKEMSPKPSPPKKKIVKTKPTIAKAKPASTVKQDSLKEESLAIYYTNLATSSARENFEKVLVFTLLYEKDKVTIDDLTTKLAIRRESLSAIINALIADNVLVAPSGVIKEETILEINKNYILKNNWKKLATWLSIEQTLRARIKYFEDLANKYQLNPVSTNLLSADYIQELDKLLPQIKPEIHQIESTLLIQYLNASKTRTSTETVETVPESKVKPKPIQKRKITIKRNK